MNWKRGLHISVFACGISPAFSHSEPTVTVAQYAWTDSVNAATRQYNRVLDEPTSARVVTLWMELHGSPALLDKLKASASGSVNVRHVWYQYDALGMTLENTVGLTVGRKEDLQKLSYDVAANGYFSWRLWSNKRLSSSGFWRVELVFANGQPVLCEINLQTQPCSFEIEVR